MEKELINKLTLLRIIAGYLGEKDQFNWWSSNFLNSSTRKMFEFTFPRTANLAQYEAVSAAAAKIHDESIGIGKSFHLFRLPEFLEKALLDELRSIDKQSEFDLAIKTKERAVEILTDLTGAVRVKGEGPVNIGILNDSQWDQILQKLASTYLYAFKNNKKAFPYLEMSNGHD